MKKVLTILALAACFFTAGAQQVSQRAKAMLMMNHARPEYQIKDVKIYADTMTVYSLSDYVVYPIGKWENVEQYITQTQLLWERSVGYKNYFDSMEVSVNTLTRLDGSYMDMFRSIHTGRVEMIAGKITDPQVILANGAHVGMDKQEVFEILFNKFPKGYVEDIHVLKVISGANEVGQIYTFKGRKLRHIGIVSRYKYY
ncbi:MAG: hypothetical protein SPJ13_07335 [Bacteroidales bacterium]|nr:hypothetical protein [Bacteroidales bacterium]